MGLNIFLRGLLFGFLVTFSCASICSPGFAYWNSSLESCQNCTRCEQRNEVVLRPCEVHRDTVCGPLSQLDIDWSWLKKHHRRHHGKHHKRVENPLGLHQEVTSTEVPFSSTETLVWDWQAVALTLAVFACFLFFLVAALYSIHQARQWKRLKDTFEVDVEELSARLNLMVTTGEIAESIQREQQFQRENGGTIVDFSVANTSLNQNDRSPNDHSYINSHCVYLEKLLVKKDAKSGPGNVYIEESNTNTNPNTNTLSNIKS